MSILRDGTAKARKLGLSGWATGKTGYSGDGVYARARPESVELTEHYFYTQEISQNPQRRMASPPSGTVELRIPYDGHEFFTRQAYDDVALTTRRRARNGSVSALVGHLLVANHSHTNLGTVLDLGQGYGSMPIRVPVGEADGIGGLDDLRADRQTCVITHEYAPNPDRIRVVPMSIEADLFDPDSLWSHIESTSVSLGGELMQQVSFRSHLILRMAVLITLPKEVADNQQVTATVTTVSLGWPTITSLRNVRLLNDDQPVRYNPLTRSIEWADITMRRRRSSGDDLVKFSAQTSLKNGRSEPSACIGV